MQCMDSLDWQFNIPCQLVQLGQPSARDSFHSDRTPANRPAGSRGFIPYVLNRYFCDGTRFQTTSFGLTQRATL